METCNRCKKGEFVSASRTFGGIDKGTPEDGIQWLNAYYPVPLVS